jgi:hypothetical protein
VEARNNVQEYAHTLSAQPWRAGAALDTQFARDILNLCVTKTFSYGVAASNTPLHLTASSVRSCVT